MHKAVVVATLTALALPHGAAAQTAASKEPAVAAQPTDLVKRKGWVVLATKHSFGDLNKRLDEAVKKNKMGVVNVASASEGAKAQGFTIPGNRVVGVFRNDFARRMLSVSTAAGIEAPIRFYVTEGPGGTATLSYRTPGAVFAPYVSRKTRDLGVMAKELDAIFTQIALDATGG